MTFIFKVTTLFFWSNYKNLNMDTRTQHLLTAPPLPLLARMATPSTLAFLIQGLVSLAEVWFIGQLGSISLAAIALAFPLLMLTQTLSGGAMGGAVASAIARALGAGDIDRAEQVGWIGGLSAGIIAGALGIVLAIFPDGWIALFTQDPLVHASAKDFIQIAGPCFLFQGLGLSLYFASQGANAMLWPVLATILRVAVAGSVSFSLGFIFDIGLVGICYGAALGMISYAIIIAGALKLGAWRPSAK